MSARIQSATHCNLLELVVVAEAHTRIHISEVAAEYCMWPTCCAHALLYSERTSSQLLPVMETVRGRHCAHSLHLIRVDMSWNGVMMFTFCASLWVKYKFPGK